MFRPYHIQNMSEDLFVYAGRPFSPQMKEEPGTGVADEIAFSVQTKHLMRFYCNKQVANCKLDAPFVEMRCLLCVYSNKIS